MMAAFRPGWWSRRQFDDGKDDADYRIPINKSGLLPWKWGAFRGEVTTVALVTGVAFLYLGMWKTAIIVPSIVIMIGGMLHRWHPFWIELFIRLIARNPGLEDS